MFRRSVAVLSLSVCLLLLSAYPSQAQDRGFSPNTLPQDNKDLVGVKPELALLGLKESRVVVTVTEDAHHELHSISQSAGKIDDEILQAVKGKLKLLPGFKLNPSSGPPGTSQLLVMVASDYSTGIFEVILSVQELVSLSREPHTQMWLVTWSRQEHPTSNEVSPIVRSAGNLMDLFIADYLSANEKH